MFTHNLDPVLFDFGFIAIRWYSLAYIGGILVGWWLGKKLINKLQLVSREEFEVLKKIVQKQDAIIKKLLKNKKTKKAKRS